MLPNKKVKLNNGSSRNQRECGNDFCISDWLQKYKPKQINEVGVQVTKVEELKNWLLYSQNKLLLLTGPSGCGKTTTLETVCKSLAFKILEWVTPVDRFENHDMPVVFSVKKFEEFLIKSRYKSLVDSNSVKTVVVVKDLPNVFLQKPTVFHELLEKFSSMFLINPIVFICSENSLCRKLFFRNMKCNISVIRFNPITNLQMLKILKVIVREERHINKDMEVLCDKRLIAICSSSKGDIRHCVSELYFQSIKPSIEISVKHSIERSLSQPATPEKSKDSNIDFFHGIGNVFSPKKIEAQPNFKFTPTPEVMVERFLGEAKDFVDRLGENLYSEFINIYDLSNAAQRLSTSDILLSGWPEREILKEYALSVAVRGVMLTSTTPPKPSFKFYGRQGTYHLVRKARHLQLEGKSLFPHLCMLDSQSLNDILSFTKYLPLNNLNSSQDSYIKEISNL